ncbi:MAG: TonB-dependent receptor [Sphingomonas adhaesiva]|uniref:TonB-dependent siderophore receptor n=1 Tax=Sphingomonas adhaesiva TaxID=28212 RepID=UPI002FF97A39
MRTKRSIVLSSLLLGGTIGTAVLLPPTASAQSRRITVPAQPLAQALQRIAEQSGRRIEFDPDAVADRTSNPVEGARSARAAVAAAIAGSGLAIEERDGVLLVSGDIQVIARRDEAEVDALANRATTSTRTGRSLREQSRNTQVITSKTIEDQQALTVFDALRNAGGVRVNGSAVQGGVSYSVRGFAAGGILNGLPAASNLGTAAGITQPVANIERIEVLKGPDALLAGRGNLGGTVNIVTKRPFAQPLLTATAQTGSFGQARLTIDANNAINDAKTLSARVIAVAATADRNYGGYRGDEDYLFAPSIRFKNGNTDVLLGASAANQIFGRPAYTVFNFATGRIIDRPVDQPILGRDQYFQVSSTRLFGDATQQVASWLTLVLRGQHEVQQFDNASVAPFGLIPAEPGDAFVSALRNRQRGTGDAVDGYARATFTTGPVKHSIIAGLTKTWNKTTQFNVDGGFTDVVNLLTPRVIPIPTGNFDFRNTVTNTQFGQYGQYVAEFWKLTLLAGVRRNETKTTVFRGATSRFNTSEAGDGTTPDFGAVLDVTKNLSLFGNLVYGYVPTILLDAEGNALPDIRSRNLEGGLKWDLFNDRAVVNLSYFVIRQSNVLVTNPRNPDFLIAQPGQESKGVDFNITGTILPGLTAQASFVRTDFSNIEPLEFGNVIAAQPRDQYSVFLNYTKKIGGENSLGFAGGLYGSSSSAVDTRGTLFVPGTRQVDLNLFAKVGRFDLNLGVRNVFDRVNYGPTFSNSAVPVLEPRNWRLTVGYRFF